MRSRAVRWVHPFDAVAAAWARAHRLSRQHSLAEGLLLAGLVANLISGQAFRLGFPVGPDRLLIGASLLLLLSDPRGVKIGTRRALPLMAIFVMWTVFSMLWTWGGPDVGASFALLDRTLVPFILFATAGAYFYGPRQRDLLLIVLTLIGLYLGICAVLELSAASLVWPRYITNPGIGLGYGRARGPFVSPEGMGAALAMCAASAVALAARVPRGRVLIVAVAVLDVLGVGLALTRALWIATLAGVVVAVALSPRMRALAPRAVGGAVGVVAAALVFAPGLAEKFAERGGQSNSVYDRLGSNDAAVRLLGELPLTGVGWRRFFPTAADWVRQADDYPINQVVIEIHNVILSRAAELGIPAAIVFVAIIVVGPLSLVRERPSGDLAEWRVLALVVMTVWLVAGLFGPMATPFPNYVAWMIAGVALSRGVNHRADRHEEVLHGRA